MLPNRLQELEDLYKEASLGQVKSDVYELIAAIRALQAELTDLRVLKEKWGLGDDKDVLLSDRNMYKTQLVEAQAEVKLRKEFIEARKDRASAYHSFWFYRREGLK